MRDWPPNMQRHFVIKRLKVIAAEKGRPRGRGGWMKLPIEIFDDDPELPGRTRVRELFKSEFQALYEAGLWPTKPDSWTLQRSIIDFVHRYEAMPRALDAREGMLPYHDNVYVRMYGTWEAALNELGFFSQDQLRRAKLMAWRRKV